MSKARLLPSALHLATMGMEMCYLYLGLALVREHLGLGYIALALIMALYPISLVVAIISANVTVFAGKSGMFANILAIVMSLTVGILAMWQVTTAGYPIGGLILQLGFCALAWWLGNTLSYGEITHRRVSFRLHIGIFFLLVFAAAGTFLPIALFFVLALFALARARWESSVSASKTVLQAFPSGRIILGSIAVFVPGVLIFLALSPEIAQAIVHWISAVYNAIINFITAILTSEFMTTPLWQPSCSCDWGPVKEQPPPTSPPPSSSFAPPPAVIWIIIFVAFLAVMVIISLVIRKLRAQRKTHTIATTGFKVTSIRASFFRELVALLYGIVKWLWHFLLSLLGRVRAYRIRPMAADEPVVSVRIIYRNLLRWAARQALPRLQPQTPLEYLKVLCQRFPQEAKELALITRIYLRARYSHSTTTSEEFESTKSAWQKIKQDKIRL